MVDKGWLHLLNSYSTNIKKNSVFRILWADLTSTFLCDNISSTSLGWNVPGFIYFLVFVCFYICRHLLMYFAATVSMWSPSMGQSFLEAKQISIGYCIRCILSSKLWVGTYLIFFRCCMNATSLSPCIFDAALSAQGQVKAGGRAQLTSARDGLIIHFSNVWVILSMEKPSPSLDMTLMNT